MAGAYGISSGAHRLWAHKCYKANKKMQVMLLFFQTIAFQNCVLEWVRDHRVHHKFSDTNADPHNINRGFFFSHMGWLMCKKHPDVFKYGSRVDMSDLESDPMLQFQKKLARFIMKPLMPNETFQVLLTASGPLQFCFALFYWLLYSGRGFYRCLALVDVPICIVSPLYLADELLFAHLGWQTIREVELSGFSNS